MGAFLGLQGKEEAAAVRFFFCPLGAPFQAGAVATRYRRRIQSVPSVRRKNTVRRRIYGGSYLICWICPLAGCCL